MGRPLNKRYFGSGVTGHEIKITAKVGANPTADGFIVKQRGTRKFKVNVGGNVGICRLVDKADGDLLAGEMNITVLTDANTTSRVTKIYNRVAIVNGAKVKWNFSTSLTDGAVEIADANAADMTPYVITIGTQPLAASVTSPDAASFVVVASVAPTSTLAYQWQVSDDAGATWSDIAGATLATLSVESTDAEYADGNEFRVVVSAQGGAVTLTSNEVALTVA